MNARVRAPFSLDPAWIADALNRADAILAAPPRHAHQARIEPKGSLVQRLALPLDLCPTTNFTRHAPIWKAAQTKRNIMLAYLCQAERQPAPLDGRPFVRCVRFSTNEPDAFSDWAKMAVDALTLPRRERTRNHDGMGFLVDDRPKCVDVVQSWEYAARGTGFVLVEVWTG